VRVAWIPPGAWINAWTGEKVSGPATITNNTPAEQTPIYIRSGAILPLAPEMQYTGERPWDPITLDLYPHSGETNQTILYEDDTLTTAYREGRFRKTTASVSADAASKTVRVEIGPAEGAFSGALNTRAWVLRLHRPLDWPENLVPGQVKADGRKFEGSIRRLVREATAMPFGDKSGAPDSDLFELSLPAASASKAWQVEVSLAASENP
jgi:hypothetical protein